jgi:hypothetical protein
MLHPAPAHRSFADRTSLYQEITDKIIAELEQGRVPWVQPWGDVQAPLGGPHNAATGRPYSGINILILWCAVAEHGFSGQSWLTFRQALKLGAHVCKGETAPPSFMRIASFPTASARAPRRPATSWKPSRSSSASSYSTPTSATSFRPTSRRRGHRLPRI